MVLMNSRICQRAMTDRFKMFRADFKPNFAACASLVSFLFRVLMDVSNGFWVEELGIFLSFFSSFFSFFFTYTFQTSIIPLSSRWIMDVWIILTVAVSDVLVDNFSV